MSTQEINQTPEQENHPKEKGYEIKELIKRGKAKGTLSQGEIMESLEDVDYDRVVAIYCDSEVVRHLTVELAHLTARELRHILHTTHKLVLRNHHGRILGIHRLE